MTIIMMSFLFESLLELSMMTSPISADTLPTVAWVGVKQANSMYTKINEQVLCKCDLAHVAFSMLAH